MTWEKYQELRNRSLRADMRAAALRARSEMQWGLHARLPMTRFAPDVAFWVKTAKTYRDMAKGEVL